jgi:hypothetical protein
LVTLMKHYGLFIVSRCQDVLKKSVRAAVNFEVNSY